MLPPKPFFLLLIVISGHFCAAQAVHLDPTFGNAGFSTTPIGNGVDRAMALALQPDGAIVLAGYGVNDLAVVRYTGEGVLDEGFGAAGKVVVSFNGQHSELRAVTVQPDGSIVAAGFTSVPGPTGNPGNFVVLRLLADGTQDPSFGTNGVVTTQVGSSALAYCMALLPDGRILLGGAASEGLALARYMSDGSLDPSFGSGGTLVIPIGFINAEANGVGLLPDGRIMVCGSASMYNTTADVYEQDLVLLRLLENGQGDPTFGDNGLLTYTDAQAIGDEIGRALLLQPDGRCVVSGVWYDHTANAQHFLTVRFNLDGTLDTGFAGDGVALTNIGSNYTEMRDVTLQPDGKILVVGSNYQDIVLVRYHSDGQLDMALSDDGTLETDFADSYEYGTAVELQPDGRFVVAAYTSYFCADRDFAVVRYTNELTISVNGSSSQQPRVRIRYADVPGVVWLDATIGTNTRLGVSLMDAMGREVIYKDLGVCAGAITERLDLNILAAGSYVVKLNGLPNAIGRVILP